ncbi:FERM domain-containing protein 5-like [Artemia franciscana]|uniref:FERM domain-containing protein 5-like n=1 Tax=Artemia franciscana TaxID=6661 RepID=UPI0032DB64C5
MKNKLISNSVSNEGNFLVELGDFDPELHPNGYISGMRLLLQQSEKQEEKIAEIHQGASTPTPNGITTSTPNVNGLTAHQAQIALLRRSCVLDTYGVDPHAVKDQAGNQLYLGVNHTGVLTFHGGRKQHHFRWCEITKLNYEGKMFIVHFAIAEDSRTKVFEK